MVDKEENNLDKDEIAIKVSHLYKSFKLPQEKNTSIKSLVINPLKRRTFEKQEVLKDISFEIMKGEFFGIIGRNGSGKSTLLKLLAGIYSPDTGNIQVNGKLTPFIELGVGFNPELTGRENVYLNGALLGFNRKEMSSMYDEIVEFAELDKFMDQKLKNYSSGMQVRLAFSIAIRANTDILLLDEVLAVGDSAFQKKCINFFKDAKNKGKTIIFVSHDMSSIEKFCDRVLVIDKSVVDGIYPAKNAVSRYNDYNLISELKDVENSVNASAQKTTASKIIKETIIKSRNNSKIIKYGEDVVCQILLDQAILSKIDCTSVQVHITFFNQDSVLMASDFSGPIDPKSDKAEVSMTISNISFVPGIYSAYFGVYKLLDSGEKSAVETKDYSTNFGVESNGTYFEPGVIKINSKWD